jgi:hypothetical protein
VQHPGAGILDRDVGYSDQPLCDLQTLRASYIQAEALFVDVGVVEVSEVFKLTSRFCGVVVLGNLPRSFSGHSILMTSAPKAPSQRVAHGPARTQLKSTTLIFSRLADETSRRSPANAGLQA